MDSTSLTRLRRWSRVFEVAALVGAIGLTVLLAVLIVLQQTTLRLAALHLGLDAQAPGLVGAAGLALAMVIGIGPGIWALLSLSALFRRYAAGDMLSADTALRLRQLGRALLAAAIGGVLAPTVAALAMTWGNAEGERTLILSLGSETYLLVLFAGLTTIIGWATAEGARLQDENRSFV